jgi:hypothetical protein
VGSQIGGRHSNSSTSQVAKWVQQWFQPVLRLLPGQSSNNRLEDSPASRDGQDDENDDDDNNDDNEEGGDSIEGSTTKRRINGPTFADVAGTEAAKQVGRAHRAISGGTGSLYSLNRPTPAPITCVCAHLTPVVYLFLRAFVNSNDYICRLQNPVPILIRSSNFSCLFNA